MILLFIFGMLMGSIIGLSIGFSIGLAFGFRALYSIEIDKNAS